MLPLQDFSYAIIGFMSFTAENALCSNFIPAYPEVFGEKILRRANEVPRYPFLNQDVRSGIHELQLQLEQLIASPHPDDQAAREGVTRRFHEHDSLYAPAALYSATTSTDLLAWLAGADYADALNLLTWNKERLAQHQERIDRDTPELRELAEQNICQLVDLGIMPPFVKPLARNVLKLTKFVAIDTFEAGFGRKFGYFYISADRIRPYTIVLANKYEGGSDGLERWQPRYAYTVTHESLHGIMDSISAGLRTIFNENFSSKWWDESEVEHATQVSFHGEPNITAPRLRTIQEGTYQSNRELSHIIKTGGDVQIPQPLIGEASVEPFVGDHATGTKNHLVARKELDRLFHLSFKNVIDLGKSGMNIVELIDYEVSAVPRVGRAAVLNGWRQKLETALGKTA